MQITELKNDSNRVLVSKTNRNKVISDKIKPPLPNKCFTAIVSGSPSSGKSCLVTSLIKRQYRKCFHSVIIVMPPTSRSCFEHSVIEHADPEKVFDELNEDTCDDIHDIIVKTRDEGEEEGTNYYTLLVLDDIQHSLRNKDVEKKLRGWLANYRHLNLCVLCCVQSYISLSKPCRDLFRCLFQFATPNRKELGRLHEEWCGALTPEQFRKLFAYVFDKKHNFIFIDRQDNIFAKNFNKLKLSMPES